jgi:outer membrane protein assembly factor BamB
VSRSLLLLLGLLLVACSTTQMPASQPPADPTESPWRTGTPEPLFAPLDASCLGAEDFPPRLPGMRYGINTFLFATDRERALSLTTIGGFQWIRQQIHWRDLEGERGQYVWTPLDQVVSAARAQDLQIMLSVVRSPTWATAEGDSGLPDDPDDLATFLHAVATRYKGRVAAYQVWNEPNLSHENGGTPATPAEYLALLQAAYPAIKQADPCALVISAALAATVNPDPALATDDLPFFEALYTLENGAFLQVADAIGMHTGAGPYAPGALWPADAPEQSQHYFRHMERSREIMQRYGDPRQVWISEYGWTVTSAEGAPPPVSEREQADYLLDALWWVRQRYPWVAAMFVWNLNFSVIAPPEDEKTTFSILNPDWSVRPAFLSLQNNVNALRDIERAPFVPAAAGYRSVWTFPARGALRQPPMLAPGATGPLAYVVSDPGTIYAVNANGYLEWHYNAPGAIVSLPARGPDGTLFVTNSGSLLEAVGPDGALRWREPLGALSRRSPVYLPGPAGDDLVAVVTILGEVQAFAPDGTQRWRYELGSETTQMIRTSDGALFLVDATGQAVKLDAAGQEVWRTALAGEFWAAPVADAAGGAYVVTVDGRAQALDGAGALRWTTDLDVPVVAPPLLGSGGALYVAARDGTLSALDASDGTLRWREQTGGPLSAPPAQAADGTLYQGTDNERLLALAPDGTLRWQMQLRGAVRAQPALSEGGRLYVPTTSGRLYAFE